MLGILRGTELERGLFPGGPLVRIPQQPTICILAAPNLQKNGPGNQEGTAIANLIWHRSTI